MIIHAINMRIFKAWIKASVVGIIRLSLVNSGDQSKVNAGRVTLCPPFSADWCAQMPTQVQLAAVAALGHGSRSSTRAEANSCTMCGWEPPWPPP